MRENPFFDELPFETIQNVVQLLVNWYQPVEDAFPRVPPSYPRNSFLSPIASLSRVCKRLRAICRPYLFSYIGCNTSERLMRLTFAYGNELDSELTTKCVKTLSVVLPQYSVDVKREKDLTAKRLYDSDIGMHVELIPIMFSSLHCLRLHNIPNLDGFFGALRSTQTLRVLDLQVCDSVFGAQTAPWNYFDEIPTYCEKIVQNTPPLESLRIKIAFEYKNRRYFVRNKEMVIHHILALIGAAEPTLLDLSISANLDITIDMLKSLHFPRLRRLALRSVPGKSTDFHNFILAHRAHLVEVNIEYDALTETHVTLSAISRIIRGICPREGHKDSQDVLDDDVDSLVHPEDGKWGHFECESFGYAKRSGEVAELSLSIPMADFSGNHIEANEDLRFTKLAEFLAKYEQLEILTLMVSGHDEVAFSDIMNVLGGLCHRKLRKLRTLNLFVELEDLQWGAGSFPYKQMDFPGDKFMGDDFFYFSDEEEDFSLALSYGLSIDERAERWRKFEDKYYHTAHSIMSSFMKMAFSVNEVVWHFWMPQEGATSSCWMWRRAKAKSQTRNNANPMKWSHSNRLKVKVGLEPSSFVVGDLMIHGAIRDPGRFTFTVGREAEYIKTFEDWR